jgi:dolichol-phosphate mannosyltransferase
VPRTSLPSELRQRRRRAAPNNRAITTLFGDASVGRYALIGVSGVAIDTGLFVLLTHLGVIPVVATTVSTVAGIVNNYFLNARFNFRTSVNAVQFRRFLTVGLVGLGVAALSLQILIATGLAALPAKLVSLPCVVVSQFVANKYWSFRPHIVTGPTEPEA